MSTVKANDLTNVTGGIPTVKSQQLIPTAWVNFNGTGTVSISDSEGVSSITDVDTGIHTVNFSTTMSNSYYSVSGLAQGSGFGSCFVTLHGSPTTSGCPIRVRNGVDQIYVDNPQVMIQVMGGQS
jgi:hypothetical protein